MATINVSGKTQFLSAYKYAKAGDTLSLAGGSYGDIDLGSSTSKGYVTIKSASESNQAVFKSFEAKGVSGLTIDNVKFDSTGGAYSGTGLKISNSSNIKVLNSDFTDYKQGSFIYEVTGLTVSHNTFTRMWNDAMNFADITNGVISRNVYVESGSQPGYIHKDFIQFWTNQYYNQAASKNIQITNNEFYSSDNQSHGIFMNNEWHGQKYQNIDITNNYIRSSQTHGITLNYGDDVLIQNNTLVKNGAGYPVINVTPDSTNVKILYNTAPSVPNEGNYTWTVAYNKETGGTNWHWTADASGSTVRNSGSPIGSSTGPGIAGSASASASTSASSASSATLAAKTSDATVSHSGTGDGDADSFRFYGSHVDGSTKNTVSHLDFGDGDTIVLIGYDHGTFEDHNGGNEVWNNAEGTYVKIDSVADLRELATYSDAIHASVQGDDLSLTIDQHSGSQTLLLLGLGDAYLSSYASALL